MEAEVARYILSLCPGFVWEFALPGFYLRKTRVSLSKSLKIQGKGDGWTVGSKLCGAGVGCEVVSGGNERNLIGTDGVTCIKNRREEVTEGS